MSLRSQEQETNHDTVLELTIQIPLYDFQTTCQVRNKIEYMDIQHNVSLIMQDFRQDKRKYVVYSIEITNNEKIVEEYRSFDKPTTIRVYFEDEYKMLKNRCNIMREELQHLEKFYKRDKPIVPCFNLTPAMLIKTYSSKASKGLFLEAEVDINLLTASPLAKLNSRNQKVTTLYQQFDIQSELNRIRKQLCKNQNSIEISLHQATKENLIVEMQKKIKILHLLCNVVVEEGRVYLALEDKDDVGCQRLTTVEELFQRTGEYSKADLVILVGQNTSFAAKQISSYSFQSVVFVETFCYNQDKRAHLFIQNLYSQLSKGVQLKNAYANAEKQARSLPSPDIYNCCCLHPHQPNCQFKVLIDQFGVQTCHKQYHRINPQCNCVKFVDYKIKHTKCPNGKDLIILLNQAYDNVLSLLDPNQKFLCETVCCCRSPNQREELHGKHEKIGLYSDPNTYVALFKEMDAVSLTDFRVLNNRDKNFDYETMTGVNLQMYELLHGIKDQEFALNIFGKKRSGRTTIVRQAIRYLFERYYPDYSRFECNLSNVQSICDCQYIIKEALGVPNIPDLEKALTQISNLKIIVIFDNCDNINKISGLEFGKIIKVFRRVFSNLEIVAISEQKLAEETIGHRFWKIPDISVQQAVSIFVYYKEKMGGSLYELSQYYSQFKKLKENAELYYQRIDSIRRMYKQNTQKRPGVISSTFIDRAKNRDNLPDAFSEKMSDVKANNESRNYLYSLLMFLYQFEEGLTELDFEILLRLNYTELKIDWEYFICIIQTSSIPGENPLESKLEQLKQFLDIVDIKGNYYKQIRLNDDTKTYLETKEGKELKEMKISSLKYLYIFTTIVIKYLVRNYHYHQSIYQFSNISDTGIFQTKKILDYSQFYDKNCFFPTNQDITNVERAVEYLNTVCIVKTDNSVNEIKSITKLILQQKQNLIATYRINFESFQLSSEKKKEFDHYYYVLLVNVSTISITITNDINTLFIQYCIKNSIDCGRNLLHKKKTHGMLMFKLLITKLGIDLKEKPNKMEIFNNFDLEMSAIVRETWPEQSIIRQIWKVEREFILLYMLIFLGLGDTKAIPAGIKEIEKCIGVRGIKDTPKFKYQKFVSRLSLYKSEFVLRYSNCYYIDKFPNIKVELAAAQKSYITPPLNPPTLGKVIKKVYTKKIQLWVKAKLNEIECEINNPNITLKQYQDYAYDFEEVSKQITENSKVNKISDKQIIKQFQKVAEKLKLGLCEKTGIVMIYLRSSPLEEEDQSNNRNMLRVDKRYKDELSQMFINSGKESMAIFRLLTYENLESSLKYGCLLLTIIVDCEVSEDGTLLMVFEDPLLPIKDKRPVSSIKHIFSKCDIRILVICGKNSEKFCQYIKSSSYETCPYLIAMDTLMAEHSIGKEHLMSINKHLQRVTLNKFIECFIMKFSKKLVESKIQDIEFNQAIKSIKQGAYNKTRWVIGQRYDLTNKFDQLRDSLLPKIIQTRNVRNIQFKEGDFKDITYATIPQNNIESTANNVGRLRTIIEISKFLVGYKSEPKNDFFESYEGSSLFLNVYGVTGVGKKTLMTEVAYPFLERKVFEDGIFMIDCELVYSDYQGNILQYLEQKWNILFQKLNKHSKNKARIFLLLILDNFTQIQEGVNQEFFKLIEQLRIKVVITTLRKHHKKCILNTPLVKMELKQLEEYEARVLLYSCIDINYYAKHGDIETIEDQLNLNNNQSYIPGDMKKEIDRFSQKHEGHIRKKKDWKEERKNDNFLMQSNALDISNFNLGESMQFNDSIECSINNMRPFHHQQSKIKITKLKITSKPKFDTTPSVSKEMGEPSSRRMSCSEDSTASISISK